MFMLMNSENNTSNEKSYSPVSHSLLTFLAKDAHLLNVEKSLIISIQSKTKYKKVLVLPLGNNYINMNP